MQRHVPQSRVQNPWKTLPNRAEELLNFGKEKLEGYLHKCTFSWMRSPIAATLACTPGICQHHNGFLVREMRCFEKRHFFRRRFHTTVLSNLRHTEQTRRLCESVEVIEKTSVCDRVLIFSLERTKTDKNVEGVVALKREVNASRLTWRLKERFCFYYA